MSLLEKAIMINMYNKNAKKSIYRPPRNFNKIRLELFLVISVIILVITPFVLNMSFNRENPADHEHEQIYIYLSVRCEELFGKDITDSLLQEFEEKNPGIKIKIADDFSESDILIFDEGSFSSLIASNALMELYPFFNNETGNELMEVIFTGHHIPAGITGTHQFAIPLVSFIDLLFYNIDILTAAGFDSPPKTRDEFMTYARRISGMNTGISAAAFSLNQSDRQSLSRDIFSWIWASGSNFWSAGDRPFLNTRAVLNDFTFFGNLFREGLLAPGIIDTTGNQRLEEFAQGKIAMMVASAGAIPYLRNRMTDSSFGITTIPDSGSGGRYSAGISSISAAISIDCANPDEAWDFIMFLSEKSSYLCDELKAIPGLVSSIIPGNYVRNDPFYSKAWEIFEYAQIIEGFSGKPGADDYENIFLEELMIFFESGRTAQTTITAIQRRWDEVQILSNR